MIQSMSRKGNCIDNGATEQVFGHIKDEFFTGQEFPGLRDVQSRAGEVHHPLNTRISRD